MTDRFTAWAMCPKCERVECHGLRAPRSFDPGNPLDQYLDGVALVNSMWGDGNLLPSEEGEFEVIRQCKCGKEWGQV